MSRLAHALLVTLLLSTACSGAGTGGDVSPPPAEVQASFRQFADSIIPRIRDTLYQVGYRKYDPALGAASSAPIQFIATSAPVTAVDRTAGLFEGVIEGEL
ncbi:MAG: hypothetical protein ABIY52_16285, partial [Gemmatimonadaceae bacterium]